MGGEIALALRSKKRSYEGLTVFRRPNLGLTQPFTAFKSFCKEEGFGGFRA